MRPRQVRLVMVSQIENRLPSSAEIKVLLFSKITIICRSVILLEKTMHKKLKRSYSENV